MGRTTLYQYFKNKDEIFYQIISDSLEEITVQIEGIKADDRLTFIEKIKEIIYQLTMNEKNNNTFILLIEVWIVLKRENNSTLKKLRSYIQDFKDTLSELIEEAIKAKEIKPTDSRILGETIYTLIETFTLERTSYKLDANTKIESLHLWIDSLKI